MTAIETDINTNVVTKDSDGEHDRFAHIVVPASAVTEAYITGAAVRALCGKTWVPSRNPEKYSVCPSCKDIFEVARQRRSNHE